MAGNIKGITIKIGGDTKEFQKSLTSADKAIKKTQTALKDINRLLKFNPKNTELLQQKQRTLADAISKTKDKLKLLKEEQKKAAQALKDGKIGQDEYDALQREIVETESKLKNLQKQYKKFGSVAKQQVQEVGREMQELGGKVKDAGNNIKGIGTDITTRVTLPLVAIGTKGAMAFAEVDKTMQLTNKTMGNTEEQAEMLNQAMKDAASNSTFGMNDAATATLNFARAGLDAEQAANALAPAMNLAAGEGGNLDTVSQGLVGTINAFGDSFERTSDYADVFAAACNNSALDVDSLSESMSIAAPIFSAAGYSVEDAALYMGVMANNGIDANKAATSLKTGLAKLISPAKDGANTMKELGISVTNADGSMKDSVTIQKELHDAFSQLSESEQLAAASAIFGKNQMSPWLALINTAPEEVDDLSNSLENCKGTTEDMADAMMSGFGGSLEKLKSTLDVLITTIGERLAPYISKVTEKIQELADKFNALSPAQQDLIIKIGLIAAAVGPVLVIIGTVISAIGSIISGIGGLVVAFGALLSPIGLVVAAIAAVIAIGVLLYKHWDEVKAACVEIWDAIKEFITNVAKSIKDGIVKWFTAVYKFWTNIWNKVKNFFVNAWNAIKSKASAAASAVRDAIMNPINRLYTFWTNIWNKVKTFFSNIWGVMKTAASNGINGVSTTISNKLNTIKSTWSNAWNAVKSTVSTVFDTIKSTISTKLSAAKTVVSNFVSGVKTLLSSISDKIQAVINKASGAQTAGNNLKGSQSIVGEPTLNMNNEVLAYNPNVASILSLLETYLPKIAEPSDVVLDTGTLVGATAPAMNRALGQLSIRENRR